MSRLIKPKQYDVGLSYNAKTGAVVNGTSRNVSGVGTCTVTFSPSTLTNPAYAFGTSESGGSTSWINNWVDYGTASGDEPVGFAGRYRISCVATAVEEFGSTIGQVAGQVQTLSSSRTFGINNTTDGSGEAEWIFDIDVWEATNPGNSDSWSFRLFVRTSGGSPP